MDMHNWQGLSLIIGAGLLWFRLIDINTAITLATVIMVANALIEMKLIKF